MMESKLQQQLLKKEVDAESMANTVIKNPELLTEVFEGMDTDKARIKYGCLKILRLISEREPSLLYPRFDSFVELLDSDNSFLQWGAIQIIANLAAVDSENRFEEIFEKYFAPIPGPVMITAANTIAGAAKIATAKPHLTERITGKLLQVEDAKYDTEECRNVAFGHAIKSFDQFFDQIENKQPVIEFVKRQLNNTRQSTKKKAEAFLKRHEV